MRKKNIISVALSVLLSVVFVAVAANAATTISTDITTAGTLTVTGVSALTGAVYATSTLQATGAVTAYGNVTLGDAVADTTIVNGRISTGSVAGAALTLDSTYLYTEGVSLKYSITSWTGIGNNTFKGLYISPRVYTANANGSIHGLEVNTSNGLADGTGVALGEMHGAYLETQVKPIAADTTVGPIYGIESQISLYAPTAGTLTLTEQSDVGVAAGRFQLGMPASGNLADWTSVYGVLIQANGAQSKTLGSALLIRNYPDAGVYTWTKGIQITAPAVTGISLEGAMTNDISFQNSETIDNVINGVIRTNATSSINGFATTTAEGVIMTTVRAAAPVTCSATYNGGISFTSKKTLCVCDGTNWIIASSTAGTACSW